MVIAPPLADWLPVDTVGGVAVEVEKLPAVMKLTDKFGHGAGDVLKYRQE